MRFASRVVFMSQIRAVDGLPDSEKYVIVGHNRPLLSSRTSEVVHPV